MSNTKKIQWHPGFVAAMDLELAANRKDLIYEKEYNLNTKPLEIDLLVIKKDSHVRISNEIGELFRKYNIIEYKSPDDHLDVDALYKTGAYASLYKAYGETSDKRKAEDITVTIVRRAKPIKLFRWLREHDFAIENPYKGIYYILDGVLFPTQIIVTRELDRKNHMWLNALSGKMQRQDMEDLLETINSLTQRYDRELADSVLNVTARANEDLIEELRGDGIMCEALMEIMAPEIAQRVEELTEERVRQRLAQRVEELTEERVRQRLEQRVEQQIKQLEQASVKSVIEALQEYGISDSEIRKTVMKKFHLSEEKIEVFL